MNSHKKLPNFYIIGAPKCGTTSMAHWLGKHPQVFMSKPKEPHYFNTDLANRNVRSWNDYLSIFATAESRHIAIGEASTWYLYSREAIDNIEKHTPDARYIVMTRDLVEMAYSLYLHNLRKLHEDSPTFEIAWNKQSLRRQGRAIPKFCAEPAFLQYREVCSLGTLIERLFKQVPKERVFHLTLESVREDPRREYLKVLAFLKLADDGRENFPVLNEARALKSRGLQTIFVFAYQIKKKLGLKKSFGVTQINHSKKSTDKINQETYKYLKKEFELEYYKLRTISQTNQITD